MGRFAAELSCGFDTHHIQPVLDCAKDICTLTRLQISEIQRLADFATKSHGSLF